ncbi:hypothetical protein GCM10009654_57260 [Streptomyces hebeiensis]|uniref:Uncharacterized protein n=1 Tax=Streptomyces hebeiensis TaxID=229486 RepID=A0ABP4FQJ0_9ACTN
MEASEQAERRTSGGPMFEYELHKIHAAELIRTAERHRLAREIRRARRAARDAKRKEAPRGT